MVFTCRVLCPLVITKASVRPSNSPMARMVVLSPDLLSAARAATRHSAGTSPPSWSTSGRALVRCQGWPPSGAVAPWAPKDRVVGVAGGGLRLERDDERRCGPRRRPAHGTGAGQLHDQDSDDQATGDQQRTGDGQAAHGSNARSGPPAQLSGPGKGARPRAARRAGSRGPPARPARGRAGSLTTSPASAPGSVGSSRGQSGWGAVGEAEVPDLVCVARWGHLPVAYRPRRAIRNDSRSSTPLHRQSGLEPAPELGAGHVERGHRHLDSVTRAAGPPGRPPAGPPRPG